MKTLKTLRQQKGLTQQELAKLTGIHYSSISKFEKGHQEPKDFQRKILEDVLGESFEYTSDYASERVKRLALEEENAELKKQNKDLWSMYSEAADKLRKIEQITRGY